ncbi:MAG: heavy-metal-associated domain-containing protein [Alphaproteobacteria bacterium]|nr:heavy-metal-associated domain-containing protein [Alphaproteobacteria bacterium]
MSLHILSVEGMSCDGCKKAVERAGGQVPGVARIEADVAAKRAVVEIAEAGTLPAVIAAIVKAGFPAKEAHA